MFNNQLIKNIFIFTFGTVINKSINFFILPILTYYLTKEDYGMLGVMTSISTISIIYIGFFPSTFIMIKYDKFGKEKIAKYLSNIFILIFGTFFIVLGVLILLKDYLFVDNNNALLLILYISLLSLFNVIWQQLTTIIQLQKDAIKFIMLNFIQIILMIFLSLVLIIKFSWGWEGKFFAELAVFAISALYAFYYLFKHAYITIDFDKKKLTELTKFLFPLSFSIVGLYLMGTIDKIFLANLISLEAVGIYAIAITMSIVVNMIYDAIMRAGEPHMFELLNKKQHDKNLKVVKGIYLYWIFIMIFMGIYIVLIPYLFHFMIDEKFNPALEYIPILVLAYSFEGLRKPISEILNHLDKVKLVGAITFFSAMLNLVLNYVLINSYQTIGAAYATAISFGVLFILTQYFTYKHANLPWDLKERD